MPAIIIVLFEQTASSNLRGEFVGSFQRFSVSEHS